MKHCSISTGIQSGLCAILLSIAAGACGSVSGSRTTATHHPGLDGEVRGDPELEARLEVLDPSIRETGAGRFLRFELHNKSAAAERLSYAIEWFDRQGIPVSSPRLVWNPLVLEAGSLNQVEVRVPVPEAESWRWHAVHTDSVR
jgi:uncharacterized protein YcfL